MKNLKTSLALLSVLALAVAAVASGALTRPAQTGHGSMAAMNMTASSQAVQLRITLNELLGKHALLATWATRPA